LQANSTGVPFAVAHKKLKAKGDQVDKVWVKVAGRLRWLLKDVARCKANKQEIDAELIIGRGIKCSDLVLCSRPENPPAQRLARKPRPRVGATI
jgi:hypothetical protein